jgi:hypothetical protein
VAQRLHPGSSSVHGYARCEGSRAQNVDEEGRDDHEQVIAIEERDARVLITR